MPDLLGVGFESQTARRARVIWKFLICASKLDRSVIAARTTPDSPIEKWLAEFGDELETVSRARNNILWAEPISDSNLSAAHGIARTLMGTYDAAVVATEEPSDSDPSGPVDDGTWMGWMSL